MLNKIYDRFYNIYKQHRSVNLLYHLATEKLYKWSHLAVFLSDLTNRRYPVRDNSIHCEEAIGWLFSAQDATNIGGVSWGYSFSSGWHWAYPETSGYIIPTLFDFAQYFGNSPVASECRTRAIRIADWLRDIQLLNGAYPHGLLPGCHPSAADKDLLLDRSTSFETGQVIAGLDRAYHETGERHYLESALKAGDWLVENQSSDGSWPVSVQNLPRSFDSFIAWPLAVLGQSSGEEDYQKATRKNLDWCLSQQKENGWFDKCDQNLGDLPQTHGIGYAMQGLLEAGILLKDSKYIEAAQKTAKALLRIYSTWDSKSVSEQQNAFLPARFDSNWKSRDSFTLPTGNAQISIVCAKLYTITGDSRYLNASLKINEDLKSLQNLTSHNPGIRGGIKGCHPIYGSYWNKPIYGLYNNFKYLSWACKFFIDALIAEQKVSDSLKR